MSNEISLPIEATTLLRILPHRYPFLLVDRVLELDPGKRILARKNVTINEPHFVGHFPEIPIMPGVLQIECMAQAGGVLLLLEPGNEGKLALLTGIEKARFRRKVVPGDVLEIEIVVTKTRGPMGWIHCEAKVDGKIASEAEISFALAEGRMSEL
ncbi:3-hydroxyacyl-ACP dehydratase FabZ [Armatimonas rosea]|uniref:3-hydroxyacyl-[acyl-carrier-protein] dehydratase FabZ n=1 Tax=Armatimonas rosea TaxID=685828 RepID=A0A7W9W882_ARMRO|nr:3-hydroxyacyl-ACP dehydratase FabZ [Armatimonas rosea]MBB6051870.1 3-hydroxyacyl-[acyl-carrier-protein] dehydratase [Armatimonas rosea]